MRVAIIGATGYTGGELLRLLAKHEKIEDIEIASRTYKGEPLFKVHPHLREIYKDLTFISPDEVDSDLVFTATPHGVSLKIVPSLLERGMKVIDLSGDYRFENLEVYEKYYKVKHPGLPEVNIAYGLPELFRKEIKKADLVANPGCFPTGSILLLAPLVKHNLIEERVIIDAKTGVSGAGANPSEVTHFPNVNEDIKPYKVVDHRHKPEIEEKLNKLGKVRVSFTPHLAPITRGILTTAHTFLKENLELEEILKLYREFYKDEPFIRVYKEIPKLSYVRGSNYCDIGGFAIDDNLRLVLFSVIDNLVKGASGQAIQNMNIMMGFDEKEGLNIIPLNP
ncbi:N-acetyl-gamma-glutamyl-phosphate reductase [Methanocaldococcus infernus]